MNPKHLSVLVISLAIALFILGIIFVPKGSHSSNKLKVVITTTIIIPQNCHTQDSDALPDPHCTPGLRDRRVTQTNIKSTICKKGWSSSVRPSLVYTEPLKAKLVRSYGFDHESLTHFELDHLIPIELGGNPTSVKNLWPERHDAIVNGQPAGSYIKDRFEHIYNGAVCRGTMTLTAARRAMRKGTWLTG